MAKLIVIVATVGRPELTRQTVDLLADQTRPPDQVIVVSSKPSDVAGMDQARGAPVVAFSQQGLCRQRNHGLDLIAGAADIVFFFDDDFLPAPDYIANVEKMMNEDSELVGVTGELIADGVRHADGYSLAQARALIRDHICESAPANAREALYGCNMAIRVSAIQGLRFDETLPLYGWQEDIDFSYQIGQRGKLRSTKLVTGVHMGAKGGRTSGKRLGYSQIANILYLRRKGTMPRTLGQQLLMQNLLSNLVRSVRPEAHVDRRGRLLGNLLALADWARGRMDPRRILTM